MDSTGSTDRTLVLRSLTQLGAVATLVTTFLPWASSGDRSRSSYAIVDVVDRAGVLSASWAGVAWLWFVLPLACGAVLVGAAMGFARFASIAAGTIGVVVVAGAVLVARSPLVVEPGLALGIGAGAGTAGTAIGTLVMTKRRQT